MATTLVLAIAGAIGFAIYRSVTVRWPTGDVLAYRAVDGERVLVLREGQDGVFAADLVLEEREAGPLWRKGIYGLQAAGAAPLLAVDDGNVLVRATDAEGSPETHAFSLEDGEFQWRRLTEEEEGETPKSGAKEDSSCALRSGTLRADEQGDLIHVLESGRRTLGPVGLNTGRDLRTVMRCVESEDGTGTVLAILGKHVLWVNLVSGSIEWHRSLARLDSVEVLRSATGFYLHGMGEQEALLVRFDGESGEATAAATLGLQRNPDHTLHGTHFHGTRLWVGNAAGVRVLDAKTLRPLHSMARAPRLADALAALPAYLPPL